MAIAKLKTDFKDDIIDVSVNEHRKYKITSVSGEADTYIFEDKTEYIQKGTEFNGEMANATNEAVNQLIDVAEEDATNVTNLLNGTTSVKKANSAKLAYLATNANRSVDSDKTLQLSTARKINGVEFDGTKDISISDNSKLPLEKDFILINQQTLQFSGRTCNITDARIKSSSLVDIYFNEASVVSAENAGINIEAYNGYVSITASRTPSQSLVASIRIRSV